MAIDATVGGESSNSYGTIERLDLLLLDMVGTASWDDLSEETKERCAITATDLIDQHEYKGATAADDQALKFPRTGISDGDGRAIADDEIPRIVEKAWATWAFALSQDDTLLSDTGLEGFNRLKAGKVEIEPRHTRRAGAMPEHVKRFLRPLLKNSGGRVVRA